MAGKVVIRAEGLGKRYIIGHETERERYVALRDVAARTVRNMWKRTADAACGRAIVRGTTTEEFWALKDVSFEVKRGEVLGIIGRNGAGKSTLLKILSRITEPSEGRVSIAGRVASLLEVGTGFHPELTGRENINLNGAILGMSRAEIKRKFDEIVDFSGVEKFIDTPVKRYSSGMQVRLAFSVAAHLEPEILIIDEVLAVGDASFQQKCLAKMEDVAGHGRTVLFVSHNMTAVQSLCERVIYLETGEIRGDGSPTEQIKNYLTSVATNEKFQCARVGDAITIVDMSFFPNPVAQGTDLRFALEVVANSQLRLSEVAILFHALEGHRVGIVDLRPAGFPFMMSAGDRLHIEGVVRSIPLVDRQYKIGMYIDSGAFVGDVPNLLVLTVSPAERHNAYTPYAPHARGSVEFETNCFSRLDLRGGIGIETSFTT
jgi:lipopolysaccharide transport system ATP-binding protein